MCACGGQRTVFSRFFFHLLGSGEQNELVRFSRKHFYLLSYLYYLRKKNCKNMFYYIFTYAFECGGGTHWGHVMTRGHIFGNQFFPSTM